MLVGRDTDRMDARRIYAFSCGLSVAGSLGFALLTGPFFRESLITPDGLTSVRRAFGSKLFHVEQLTSRCRTARTARPA